MSSPWLNESHEYDEADDPGNMKSADFFFVYEEADDSGNIKSADFFFVLREWEKNLK